LYFSVEVSGFANWQNRPSIEGGGLGAKYLLNQFHFHWSQHGNGSEHQLDGSHYPLEVHLVHVKEGLTLEQALGQSNGIAVLGIFYQIGQNASSMAKLADGALSDVVEYEDGKV
jgi:carbonic anhydrase